MGGGMAAQATRLAWPRRRLILLERSSTPRFCLKKPYRVEELPVGYSLKQPVIDRLSKLKKKSPAHTWVHPARWRSHHPAEPSEHPSSRAGSRWVRCDRREHELSSGREGKEGPSGAEPICVAAIIILHTFCYVSRHSPEQ